MRLGASHRLIAALAPHVAALLLSLHQAFPSRWWAGAPDAGDMYDDEFAILLGGRAAASVTDAFPLANANSREVRKHVWYLRSATLALMDTLTASGAFDSEEGMRALAAFV